MSEGSFSFCPAHSRRSVPDRGQDEIQAKATRTVDAALVDQGYTSEPAAVETAAHGIPLAAVNVLSTKRRVVVPPRR